MLYRESELNSLANEIELRLGLLDRPDLDKAAVESLANEILLLFEQVIQFRRTLKNAEQ